MKKTYIAPQTYVESAQCSMLLAASRFDPGSDHQSIELTDEEYNGTLSAREYHFGDDLAE